MSRQIVTGNFSLAFEQMCGMVAISETRGRDETLQKLICHCFASFRGSAPANPRAVANLLENLYGIKVLPTVVQSAIDSLRDLDLIHPAGAEELKLDDRVVAEVQKKVSESRELESRVKNAWHDELGLAKSDSLFPQYWSALRGYLFRAFRRHGVQTVALLDPTIEIDTVTSESLSFLLGESVDAVVSKENRIEVRRAIGGFMANAGNDNNRATYVAQLADGAFSYFSLSVAPEIADNFRTRLQPLTLFLDTNFLLGVINLGEHLWGDVTKEMIAVVNEHEFPFELLCHYRTGEELQVTIDHYRSFLSRRSWTKGLARAALGSRQISGIVRHYLSEYQATGISVDTFFRPYRHSDVLIDEKGIRLYKPAEERQTEIATVYHDYVEFLEKRGRSKRYGLVYHDAALVDAVLTIRNNGASSLDAGALLITEDFNLYGFDLQSSRKEHRAPCTVLPNTFWQILRPFVSPDPGFTKSFAETFALPEFRTIGSDSAAACTRLLGLLASYRSIPEETAGKLLANDLLLSRLKGIRQDEEFEEVVSEYLAAENDVLIKERDQLQAKFKQREREEKNRRAEESAKLTELQKARDSELGALNHRIEELSIALEDSRDVEARLKRLEERREEDRKSAAATLEEVGIMHNELTRAQSKISTLKAILWIGVGIVFLASLELGVHLWKWQWLLNHEKSVPIQIAGVVAVALFFVGLAFPAKRKEVWGSSGFIAFVLLLLGLI